MFKNNNLEKRKDEFRSDPLKKPMPLGGYEEALSLMLRGWILYQVNHQRFYGQRMTDKSEPGVAWTNIGLSLLQLLEDEIGEINYAVFEQRINGALQEETFI